MMDLLIMSAIKDKFNDRHYAFPFNALTLGDLPTFISLGREK
jgi:hypothetical protein